MAQIDRLNELRTSFTQYNTYILDSFTKNPDGTYLFNVDYQEFAVSSAFINIYISWEYFIEQTFIGYLTGETGVSGIPIVRYANPLGIQHANKILIGTQKYVDWSNPEILLKLSKLYFENGEPFSSVINSISSVLFDLKTIRNACAHLSTTTSTTLDALACRLLNTTIHNINVAQFILKINPNGNGADTILDMYIQYLDAAAQNISQ